MTGNSPYTKGRVALAALAVTVLLSGCATDFSDKVNLISQDASTCKLEENSWARQPGQDVPEFNGEIEIQGKYAGPATAFPFAPTALPITGSIDVALVYVDWADNAGNSADFEYYQQQVDMFKKFYWMASENKLEMKIHSSKTWYRIPGNSADFSLTHEDEAQRGAAPKKQVFYDAAVKASDSEVDYSGIEIVFFAIPRDKTVFELGGPHEFGHDHNGYLKTAEGNIFNTATPGDFFLKHDEQPAWVYYVHETGHMLGIPHQANEEQNKPNTEKYIVNPLGGYDIMSNQGGATRTITAWLRWLAGWLDDSQVICLTPELISDDYFELTPINKVAGDKEAIVVKISATKALVIESRRYDPEFDIETGNSKDGLIAYTVDTTKSGSQGSQQLVSPRDIKTYLEEKNTYPDWRELDVVFHEGDRLRVDGISITAMKIGESSDIVHLVVSK